MLSLGRVLGSGTYGKVYAVNELATRRRFALKRLLLDPETRSSCVASLREVDMLSRLDHPHLLPLTKVITTPPVYSPVADLRDDQISLLLPRASGSMDDYLSSYDLDRRKSLLYQMLAGLHHLANRRIVHRDLKPQNFLLFDEVLKIADFGLATNYLPAETRTPQMVTIWYRAPEILAGHDYGLPSDVWSLGCIFAETITGRALFAHSEEKEMLTHIYQVCGGAPPSWVGCQLKKKYRGSVPMTLPESSRRLHRELGLSRSELEVFGEESYRRYLDLVTLMLQVDPHRRPSAEALLHHEFFDDYRPLLASVTTVRPVAHSIEAPASRRFGLVVFDRQTYGILYRVKFLALDLLDRIILHRGLEEEEEVREVSFVCLYLAEKYWLGERACSIDDLTAEASDDFSSYPEREKEVLKDLNYRLYRPTLYDYLPVGSGSLEASRTFALFRRIEAFNGMRLDYLAQVYLWTVAHWWEVPDEGMIEITS